MAGHSHWATIKHKKAKEDAKRGLAFTKIIKEITVAARVGGGDPAGNPRLRLLLEKAKDLNMPLENAQRAIKKGTGELPGVSYEEYTYEGYGPYGIAVMIDTLSDNKNRTVAELRRLLSENGGNLADSGSVAWMFERLGVIRAATTKTEDELLELLLDHDIKDLSIDNGTVEITSEIKAVEPIKKVLLDSGIKIESAEIEWVAKNTVPLSGEQATKAYDFLSALQDHDDVQNVYTNLA